MRVHLYNILIIVATSILLTLQLPMWWRGSSTHYLCLCVCVCYHSSKRYKSLKAKALDITYKPCHWIRFQIPRDVTKACSISPQKQKSITHNGPRKKSNVQQDHDIWCTSNLLTTLVTCWHQFLAISAEWRFHGKLITFKTRIFTSIPTLILFLCLHMYLSKRHKTIIYHWKSTQ